MAHTWFTKEFDFFGNFFLKITFQIVKIIFPLFWFFDKILPRLSHKSTKMDFFKPEITYETGPELRTFEKKILSEKIKKENFINMPNKFNRFELITVSQKLFRISGLSLQSIKIFRINLQKIRKLYKKLFFCFN